MIRRKTTPPQPFYGPFSGTTRVAGARRELLDSMVQGKINKGRHTDHPTGRHSIQTNQCPPPSTPRPHSTKSDEINYIKYDSWISM